MHKYTNPMLFLHKYTFIDYCLRFYENYVKYKEEAGYLQVGRWPPCHVLPTSEMNNQYVRLSI